MVLLTEVQGIFPTNAYFYIDDESKHGFLIDPGAEASKLFKIIDERQFTIEKILLTHGHFDHIGAVNELQEKFNVPVCMQKNGRDYALNIKWNLSDQFGLDIILNDVTYLDDYNEIILSNNPDFKLKLIPTPGHTTDGAIYYSAKDGVAFVGDTIFKMSSGRTDFYGGDEKTLMESITKKIFTLPDETFLLSGHSEPTTVKSEKSFFNRLNPFSAETLS